jgi:imidazolonepropionase-like amidohydrolase
VSPALLLALLAFQALPPGGEDETVALRGVRIMTVAKGTIETGTILIRGSKILDVGADLKIPEGARVLDRKGLVVFPGVVHALSRLGLSEGSTSGTTPQQLAYDELNPLSDAVAQASRSGVTTFAIQPSGSGFSGRGVLLKPSGWTREQQVMERAAFVRIVLEAGTAAKDALKQALEGGRKAIEAEKKTPTVKPDEKTLPVVQFLKGELPAIVEAATPGELLHFWQLLDGFSEFKPRIILAVPVDAYKAAAELGARQAQVILRPLLALAPFTRERINTALELDKAGARVALAPFNDSPEALQGIFFRVGELVKCGLPRDKALRALTLTPAEMLGIEKRVGSIEAGKDADLLLFSGDPLSSQSRLQEVYLNGKPVTAGE